jgi:hypothetical protein
MRPSVGDIWMQRALEKKVTFGAQIVRIEIDLFRCIGEPRSRSVSASGTGEDSSQRNFVQYDVVMVILRTAEYTWRRHYWMKTPTLLATGRLQGKN